MVSAHHDDHRPGGGPEGPDRTAQPTTPWEAELRRLAGAVPDPELPVLTLEELGVLRDVQIFGPDRVEVRLTPTYTGCPAIETMSADIERVLHDHGVAEVTVRRVLSPPWSTDDISDEGRRKLRESGIAPPRAGRAPGPVSVPLGPTRTADPADPSTPRAPDALCCPNCGSSDTELLSRFSSTACKALRRCLACREPFDHFKEV
jgi:ring-1,2-phenylacetyl-CoA epoxidase subunit PaaD